MSRGPLPSQLCLLSDLPARPQGDKVRFLGCVTAYSTQSAVLTLEHRFPKGSDISTRIGEWVNVVGYLTPAPPGTRAKGTTREPRIAAVQAIMLWPAGPLNLQRYEASFATT
ncbi:uncharacterized protein CCOS01_05700 [Colletotrichum costaricense]|uniref:Uncharacterized protein n=2 Tax=Colletotrichum acutatum species complex TaxID=2707335 RepID=A0AAI9Z0M4_9PEZI|nr:uncharacterized protein CCOS01_05700 [Colletotrichum costaricense]XP_060388519.1 uncharacterized protein CTAM01_01013 [Colletotrichum tamarilloi]KAK1512083.1 hypothetical protein CTAM01_01013 [Colletotrichum tamarilloi]KAK1530597.1 hypothetical protein CCOS01_05700 [Colletotrichum costaricense]